MVRQVLAVTWLALAVGCASRYDNLVKRARTAEAGGDSLAAARYYGEACRAAKRSDDPACTAAAANARSAREKSLTAAARPCRAGDYRVCAAALAPALELDPADPTARTLLVDAGEAHARRCADGRGDDPSDRARVAACLGEAEQVIAVPAYRDRVAEARRLAAAAFYALARSPDMVSQPGARLLLLDAALAHVDDATVRGQRDEARAQLDAGAAVAVGALVSARGPGTDRDVADVCASLQLGARARCAGDPGADGVRIAAAVTMDPLRYESWAEHHSTRYQSGVRRYPNPAYDGAQHRAARAERALQQVEHELVEARVDCESAKRAEWNASGDDRAEAEENKRRLCERLDGVERIYRRRSDERDSARRDADDTPAFIEEPVFDVHQWTSRHFRWSAAYAYRIDLDGGAHGGDGVVERTDRAQPGFAPAGVEGIRRGPEPTAGDLYRDARARVVAKMRALGDDALRARSDRRASECAGPVSWTASWLQCRAEAQLWRGEAPGAGPLLRSL